VIEQMTPTAAIAARPKTTLVSLLVVAFLCGAAAGAVGMRRYAFRAAHHSIALSESKAMTLARWRSKLDLTDNQAAQIRTILDDFNKYYDNVVAEGHERIIQVLTPEQRAKFEKMLRERY
jgi:Spy/CpxP family protein refolding chaperone